VNRKTRMNHDYQQITRDSILDESFIRAVFSGRQRGRELPWIKVVVRPVLIKGMKQLQFSYFDEHKDISKNFAGGEAAQKTAELIDLPFSNIHLETGKGTIDIRITKKGKVFLTEKKFADPPETVDFSHDRQKKKILSSNESLPFLQAVGIMTRDGKIKADMQRKFRQINEFLRLVEETKAFDEFIGKPMQVVDFGCGNAYLTFAIYYYLNNLKGIQANITGVDIKADLLESHQEKARELGWDRLTFQVGRIEDYQPLRRPDMVLALHACDTATDDALAQGIRWESKVIVTAPCCQHDLQEQLSHTPMPPQFTLLSHDGILFERMGDILTDALRAAILRIMGYRTEVIQFVSTEHTAKNLMIRSVKAFPAGEARYIDEYQALKNFWNVTPYLERLLSKQYPECF
jgi:SAM-dependent methyltransferase